MQGHSVLVVNTVVGYSQTSKVYRLPEQVPSFQTRDTLGWGAANQATAAIYIEARGRVAGAAARYTSASFARREGPVTT